VLSEQEAATLTADQTKGVVKLRPVGSYFPPGRPTYEDVGDEPGAREGLSVEEALLLELEWVVLGGAWRRGGHPVVGVHSGRSACPRNRSFGE
jgi:hypothetical protein